MRFAGWFIEGKAIDKAHAGSAMMYAYGDDALHSRSCVVVLLWVCLRFGKRTRIGSNTSSVRRTASFVFGTRLWIWVSSQRESP